MTKNAIITGASKGIGKQAAILFAQEGFNLALCARNEKELNQLKNELEKEYAVKVFVKSVDLSIKTEVNAFGDDVLMWFKQVDVLVNNAGIFIPGKITEEENDTFERQMAINLSAVYHLCRKVAPNMIAHKQGHIINICSTASFMPYINGGSYCISKFGALGLTKVLREELKTHQIKVTAIMPGATKTDSWKDTTLPDSRFINPKSVAKMIVACATSTSDIVQEEIIVRPQLGDIV